jgi:hypothetical protein
MDWLMIRFDRPVSPFVGLAFIFMPRLLRAFPIKGNSRLWITQSRSLLWPWLWAFSAGICFIPLKRCSDAFATRVGYFGLRLRWLDGRCMILRDHPVFGAKRWIESRFLSGSNPRKFTKIAVHLHCSHPS